jgi:hypothetical protein
MAVIPVLSTKGRSHLRRDRSTKAALNRYQSCTGDCSRSNGLQSSSMLWNVAIRPAGELCAFATFHCSSLALQAVLPTEGEGGANYASSERTLCAITRLLWVRCVFEDARMLLQRCYKHRSACDFWRACKRYINFEYSFTKTGMKAAELHRAVSFRLNHFKDAAYGRSN